MNRRNRPSLDGFHMGEIIRKEVEKRRLTYKEFGQLIGRNEKTIPDIYERAHISIELLITISNALNIDFFKYYYDEYEVLRKFRFDEVATLRDENTILQSKNESLEEELTGLKAQLKLINNVVQLQMENLLILKERSNVLCSHPIKGPTVQLPDARENELNRIN